jgi:hypothetical protein
MQGLFFKIRIQIMYKVILFPFLVFGMGLLPLVANSSMGKHLQEAQSVFPMERTFLTSLVEDLLASNHSYFHLQAVIN